MTSAHRQRRIPGEMRRCKAGCRKGARVEHSLRVVPAPRGPTPWARTRLVACCGLLLTGCAGQAGPTAQPTDTNPKDVAHCQAERGPVRVTVDVSPSKARLSDEPILTLSIEYERGVTVHKPPFGEALGDFLIRDFKERLPRIERDREVLRQVYRLEPTRTGKLAIAPISVRFADTRPGGDGREHAVETEGLTVEVASVVASEVPSLAELRPLAPPVALPASAGFGWVWIGAGSLVVAAGGLAIWYLRKRRRSAAAEPQLSPEELAYLELDRILEGNLVEVDVKQFYVELTGVIRRYIERTKGIHAPELTTEEFLREIGSRRTFPEVERDRLKWFLESADLVKFAAHQPRKEDIEESFRRAKVFIGLEPVGAAA